MIWKNLVQAVADEPPDCDVDLSLAQQPPIVHHAQQKASEHQAHGHFGIDPRPAVVVAVKLRHLASELRQIQYPIDLGEDVIVGNELAE